MRRKAIQAYTSKDGLHIPAGHWVCAPSRSIMVDPVHYSNDPTKFDGFRFVDKSAMEQTTTPISSIAKYTDTEPRFLFWSHGRRA